MSKELASRLDIKVHRGSKFTQYVQLHDSQGDPYDFTDMDVRLKIAYTWDDDNSILEIPGEIVCQPTDGQVRFHFSPETTESLDVIGYDATVMVDNYVALQGRLGILPRNPEVGE